MNMIFTREGFRALRLVYLVTLAAMAASIFLVGSAYLYWQAEKRNNLQSVTAQQEARARLDAARRERDDLRDSEQTYKVITARGVFQPEQRLDLVEAFAALKNRHHLVALEYEVQPQRPLKLSGNTNLSAVDVFGSRIKFKARAFHDGDLVGFLDEFPRMQRGFFPLDRCALRRTTESETALSAARLNRGQTPASAADGNNNSAVNARDQTAKNSTRTGEENASLTLAALEAECSLEWITLVDKRNPVARLPPAPSGANQK